MEAFAALAGRFLGIVIGEMLKIAGPQIEQMLYNAISRALSDRAVIAKPKEELQNEIKNADDPGHVLGFRASVGMRQESNFRATRDRGENR